jgi:hypothetical protein
MADHMPTSPRYTRQRIDAPHAVRFCADMGALVLLARQRQRRPHPAEPRRPARDTLARLRQDLMDVEHARQLYAERMQRIVERILRPEIALTGEPENTVDLWRVTLTIWQRRSEQLHAEALETRPPAGTSVLFDALPAPIDATLTAALAACWDALIDQALDGLEAATALCTGHENVRPAYEAALASAAVAPALHRQIAPPAEPIRQLVDAVHQHTLARQRTERDAEAQQFEAEWRALDRRLRAQADRNDGCLGWLVLLALIGLS